MLQQSVEYLHIPITGPDVGNISAADIEVSFGTPDNWHPVDDYTGSAVRILVGPGTGVGQLPAGVVDVYVRVTSNPERPILRCQSGVYITAA